MFVCVEPDVCVPPSNKLDFCSLPLSLSLSLDLPLPFPCLPLASDVECVNLESRNASHIIQYAWSESVIWARPFPKNTIVLFYGTHYEFGWHAQKIHGHTHFSLCLWILRSFGSFAFFARSHVCVICHKKFTPSDQFEWPFPSAVFFLSRPFRSCLFHLGSNDEGCTELIQNARFNGYFVRASNSMDSIRCVCECGLFGLLFLLVLFLMSKSGSFNIVFMRRQMKKSTKNKRLNCLAR